MHKVLVVDDDADLRLSVASALSENHYSVDQAADGERADRGRDEICRNSEPEL